MRCTLDSHGEKYSCWTATVYAQDPGEKLKPLLGFEGHNVCRVVKKADASFDLLTREVSYYRDLKAGKITDQRDIPYTGQTDEVMQVHNDLVNSHMPAQGNPKYPMPWNVVDNDVMLLVDMPLDYPNEADFPADVQAYTRKHFPKFIDAPTTFVKPNETTWSVYRDMQQTKQSGAKGVTPNTTSKNHP